MSPGKATRWADEPNEDVPANAAPCYDMNGQLLYQQSMESGERWMLMDAMGKPMAAWDEAERQSDTDFALEKRLYYTEYDTRRRPQALWLRSGSAARVMIERFEYRDTKNPDGSASASLAADQAANLIGQAALHYDPSGRVELVRRDFKGNPLEIARRLNNLPAQSLVDWQSDPEGSLEAEEFTQISAFDALNRLTLLYNWHRGAGSRVAVYQPAYNERGLLLSETLTVRARKTADGADLAAGVSLNAIEEIRYNAKGQKIYLARGDAALTEYDYDPETFRLRQIFTTRPANARPAANRHAQLADSAVVQDLSFTFDPAGNLVECEDEAYEPVFFRNQQVEPRSQYEYDALYRLTRANGRENSALTGAPENVEGPWTEARFAIGSGDPNAMRNYTQWFDYDAAGNLERLRHQAGPGSWTRRFHLADDSNRLLASWENGDEWAQVDPTVVIHYQFDTHGNTRNLNEAAPQFNLRWDHCDMIGSIFLGGGGTASYQYDSAKQRTRKRIVNQTGTGYWERIYLGGYELYRRYRSADATAPVEEIDSLHLMEGGQRLLLVDDVITTDRTHADGTPFQAVPVFRFQFSNHLGSSNLELDEQGTIVSYEEFHPYGTSAYRLTVKDGEAPAKRYRYTGMERDEESGLSYHTARYYALWLGRWVSADPQGLEDGTDLYRYAGASPVKLFDPGGQAGTSTPLEKEVVAQVLDLLDKLNWSYSAEVEFSVGGIPGRADMVAHPPGQPSKLFKIEVKRDNPNTAGALSKDTWNQRAQEPHLEAGKSIVTPRDVSNVSIKAGEERSVTAAKVYPENFSEFRNIAVEATPGLSERIAKPPTVRRVINKATGERIEFTLEAPRRGSGTHTPAARGGGKGAILLALVTFLISSVAMASTPDAAPLDTHQGEEPSGVQVGYEEKAAAVSSAADAVAIGTVAVPGAVGEAENALLTAISGAATVGVMARQFAQLEQIKKLESATSRERKLHD